MLAIGDFPKRSFYIMVILMHFHWFFKRVGNNSCTKKLKHVMDCPRASSEMSHPCPHITSNLLVWRIHLARESHLTLGCQWNWKFKCNTMMMTCNPIARLIGINHLPLFPCQWTWTFQPPYWQSINKSFCPWWQSHNFTNKKFFTKNAHFQIHC
jgi:hypothetical protein